MGLHFSGYYRSLTCSHGPCGEDTFTIKLEHDDKIAIICRQCGRRYRPEGLTKDMILTAPSTKLEGDM